VKAIIVLLIVFALAWCGFERYNDGQTYTQPIEYSKCTTADGHVIYGQPLPGVECVKNESIKSAVTVVSGRKTSSKSSGMDSKSDSKSSVSKGKYRCDGRTYCSEMTSCEEAEFFLGNCPNVAMDGDYDGVPCEHQWCS
jgi:hypothetical protein